jgi:alanine racemase
VTILNGAATLKAGAYGHGFEAALKGLAGTDGFGLIDLRDGQLLRAKGWKGRILLLEGVFSLAEHGARVSA